MEQHYDKMGAVTPDEAAKPFADFVEKLDMSMSGKLWAPSESCHITQELSKKWAQGVSGMRRRYWGSK